MHRIDSDGNVGGQFVDGDPTIPSRGTMVDAAWLNDVQENLCTTIEDTGAPLAKGDSSQLKAAILWLVEKVGHVFTEAIEFANSVLFSGNVQVDGTFTTNAGITNSGGAVASIGAANGVGVQGTGGAGNAKGVQGTGTGSGPGVYGTGGAAGDGVEGHAGGAGTYGVRGVGNGSGAGVYGIGGSSGPGGKFETGSSTAGAPAIESMGPIDLSGSQTIPGTTPVKNKVCKENTIKAWGYVSNGGATVLQTFNIASIVRDASGGYFTVTFAQAMASADYFVMANCDDPALQASPVVKSTTGFQIQAKILKPDTASPPLIGNATTAEMSGKSFGFVVLGAQ